MRQALDDLIWDFSDEQNLDLAPEQVLMMKIFLDIHGKCEEVFVTP